MTKNDTDINTNTNSNSNTTQGAETKIEENSTEQTENTELKNETQDKSEEKLEVNNQEEQKQENKTEEEPKEEEKEESKDENKEEKKEEVKEEIKTEIKAEAKPEEKLEKVTTKKEINLVEAQIPEQPEKMIKEETNEDKTTLTKIKSKIEYNNIIQDIDLQYNVISNGVKESLILNNKQAIQDKFTFIFDTGKLKAELTEENEIILYNGEKSNIIYTIQAPYMFDNKFEFNYDIKLELEEIENTGTNKYKMTITPNTEWIEEEIREYPITIDPTIITSQMRSKIQDTFIYNGDTGNTTKGNAHIIRIGNSKHLGGGNPGRGLIKFDLPELSAGDQVVQAKLCIFNYGKTSEWTPPTRKMQLDVHKMTTDWEENSAYWNNLSGSNNYDTRITDYVIYQFNSSEPTHCFPNIFDITTIAKDWYTTGNNYGVMIKEHNEISGYKDESDMYFISSDTSTQFYEGRPVVSIEYRNQTGLESYLNYHVQDAGRAGTVYTNDYNGNVVWIHSDASTPGTRLPVTINHVYNTNDLYENIGYGYGVRLNLSQTIKPVTIGSTNYLEYVDEDGTRHYFTNENGVWKDEDGLSLEVTNNNDLYIMKDKNGNKSTFTHVFRNEHIWALCEVQDTSGNKIQIEFTSTTNNNTLIKKVTDAAGQSITLQYSGGILSEITDYSGRKIKYTYNSVGGIDYITYPDGKKAYYNFAGNMLYAIRSIDNSRLVYEYYQERTRRIQNIKEYSSNDELGKTLNIKYGSNLTIFKDNEGYTNNMTFNNYGQAISISDFGKNGINGGDSYGKSYEYGNSGGSKNKLTLEGKLICSSLIEGNILPNGSFNYGPNGIGLWSGWNTNANDKSYTVDGTTALGLTGDGFVDKNMYQKIMTNGQKGDALKFSGWVKANGISIEGQEKFIRMIVAVHRTDGPVQWNRTIINTDSNAWQYVTQETIADGPYNAVTVYLTSTYSANTTYFTNLSFTKNEGGNVYSYDEKRKCNNNKRFSSKEQYI